MHTLTNMRDYMSPLKHSTGLPSMLVAVSGNTFLYFCLISSRVSALDCKAGVRAIYAEQFIFVFLSSHSNNQNCCLLAIFDLRDRNVMSHLEYIQRSNYAYSEGDGRNFIKVHPIQNPYLGRNVKSVIRP